MSTWRVPSVGMDWSGHDRRFVDSYAPIYGSSFGAFILGDSLKIANLSPQPLFGLYSIDELQAQPEVRWAVELDAEIQFFADASNTWFYGHKRGHMWVYDAETRELDDLGELEDALGALVAEWEATASEI